jgi:signal transduction histidine kinase
MADIVALPEVPLPQELVVSSKWLPRVRTAWFALVVLIFTTFLFSIPDTYRTLTTVCDPAVQECGDWSQPTPQTLATLDQYGISLKAAAIYHLTLYIIVSLVFWGAGLLVLRHRSHDWHGLLVSYLLITLGAGGVSFVFMQGSNTSILPDFLFVLATFTIFPMYLALSLFFLTFPDGHIYPRWARFMPLLILANYGAWLAPGRWNIQYWPELLSGLWIVFVFGSHVAVQGVRYRRYYTQEQRQQTKWLIFGFGIVLTFGIGVSAFAGTLLNGMLEGTFVALLYLPIVVAVTIAILRYRLWDIDIIISRTLVYALLTALVVGIYVLIVGTLSAFFESSSDSLAISLSATGVVAITFQPMRGYLQRIVDRIVFGERNNPYEVISRLSAQLEANVSPGTLLPGIAETVAQTLKLPYVSIAIKEGDEFKTDAAWGQPSDQGRITTLPLVYGQETVGQMVIGQVAGDKMLSGAEQPLLENIARQTGIAVHAVQLTKELQQSRLHIITAREEERRRLRRDLHDGLGPTLASHTLKIGTARALLENSPDIAATILADLENSLAASLTDIRRLVYNLRPPALDQLGLAGALCDFVEQYDVLDHTEQGVIFTVTIPDSLPPLPAAVEVAAYRIVQEAVNNVVRHANAQRAEIDVRVNEALDITVIDDGRGLPERVRHGVGLNSMQERAGELGGYCTFENRPGGGTRLHARIPLP